MIEEALVLGIELEANKLMTRTSTEVDVDDLQKHASE